MSTTIIIMLICLAGSAFFSGTETAFTSFNRAKMKALAEEGNKKATLAMDIAEKCNPGVVSNGKFTATCKVLSGSM